jgi:hypothetical protein
MKTSPHDGIAPPEELQRQAAAWLRQFTSGRASDTDAEAFLQWKRASPAHQAAFEEARRRWQLLKPALGELLREDPQTLAHHRQALRGAMPQPALGRRAFVGAAVGALAVAGIAVVRPPLGLWPAASTWTADFHTGTGEQQAIALAERIDVLLNTQTSVRRVEAGGFNVEAQNIHACPRRAAATLQLLFFSKTRILMFSTLKFASLKHSPAPLAMALSSALCMAALSARVLGQDVSKKALDSP